MYSKPSLYIYIPLLMIKDLLACVILNLFFHPQMLHMEIVACPFSCQVIISLALGDRDCAIVCKTCL